jgi:hypothetical protein
MQFDWSIAVQDQAILHEELKCLRGILKISLSHVLTVFYKTITKWLISKQDSVIHALGMLLDFRKA